jgi:hypothetical protein
VEGSGRMWVQTHYGASSVGFALYTNNRPALMWVFKLEYQVPVGEYVS